MSHMGDQWLSIRPVPPALCPQRNFTEWVGCWGLIGKVRNGVPAQAGPFVCGADALGR